MRSFPLEALGALAGRLIWLGLIHSVWIGLFSAAGVALIFQTGSRLSHRARYAILLFAMTAVAVGPGAIALLLQVFSSRAPTIALPGVASTIMVVRSEAATGAANPEALTKVHKPGESSGWIRLGRILAWAVDGVCRLRGVIIGVWLPGTAGLGAFLILGAWRMRRLCRESVVATPRIAEQTRRLARRLRLRRSPRMLVHPGLAEPFLCGVFQAVIVLPGRWLTASSPEQLDAILAHELAHARRLDHLVNLAQRLVEVGLFFHPAVHWLSRSLRRERELCTDALAVRLTRDPLALAEALQSVARLRLHVPSAAGMPLLSTSLGGQTVSLLPRIQELIGMTPTRPQPHIWPLAALPAAGLIALIATAAGLAQDDRPSSSPSIYGSPVSVRTDSGKILSTDHQIAYEVRICQLPAGPWRELLHDRLQTVKQEADVSAWIMDDKALRDFLTFAQKDPRCGILQAPKITTFEDAHAVITNTHTQRYVASMERIEKGFRPVVKNLDIGVKVDLTGTYLPRGMRLSVDSSDTTLLGFQTLVRKVEIDGQIVSGEYMLPATNRRSCKVSLDLPEGANLVISTGLSGAPRARPSGITGIASNALESTGLGKIQPWIVERLVIITPRRIVLEPEERPVRPRRIIETMRLDSSGR